jgi:hypothetical protein
MKTNTKIFPFAAAAFAVLACAFLSDAQTQTQSPSPTPSASATPTQLQSPSASLSQTISQSQSLSLSPSSSQTASVTSSPTSSQVPTASPTQTRSSIPVFCDAVVDGTCYISSWKVGDNCTGQSSLFNITDDVPQDFDACTITFDGSMHLLTNASLTCALPEVCLLSINVSGSLVLDTGSFIKANTVTVNSSALTVASGASISAAGLGFLSGPGAGAKSLPGSGGSYGGSGGRLPCARMRSTLDASTASAEVSGPRAPAFGPLLAVGLSAEACCDGTQFFSNVNESIGSWSDPVWSGYSAASIGSGGGPPGAGRGGGRVLLSAGAVVIDGDVSADGGLPVNPAGAAGGAGSGGSIVISATALSGAGKVHANGGDASSADASWAAGGGGRVSVTFWTSSMAATAITARGGHHVGNPAFADCLNGAAGTVVMRAYTGDSILPLVQEVKVSDAVSRGWRVDCMHCPPTWVLDRSRTRMLHLLSPS